MVTYKEAISPAVQGQMTKDFIAGVPERQRGLNAQPVRGCNTRVGCVIGKTRDPGIWGGAE